MKPAPATDYATVIGIALVGVCAAAFSTSSLFQTARESGVPVALAWVLPVATDVCAMVCTRVWLSPRHGAGIRRYAATIVLIDMLLSFVGASLHLVVSDAPVWLRMAVGGLPSLTLAALVHLGALIGAERAEARATPPDLVDASGVDPASEPGRPPDASTSTPVPARAVSSGRPRRDNVVVSMTRVGDKRAAMMAYLDDYPDTSGAELDRRFETVDYGRGVLRAWKRTRAAASGE